MSGASLSTPRGPPDARTRGADPRVLSGAGPGSDRRGEDLKGPLPEG